MRRLGLNLQGLHKADRKTWYLIFLSCPDTKSTTLINLLCRVFFFLVIVALCNRVARWADVPVKSFLVFIWAICLGKRMKTFTNSDLGSWSCSKAWHSRVLKL